MITVSSSIRFASFGKAYNLCIVQNQNFATMDGNDDTNADEPQFAVEKTF
jgi:hypothetical protein